MIQIQSIIAREILDSRGKPTVEVDLVVISTKNNAVCGRAKDLVERQSIAISSSNPIHSSSFVSDELQHQSSNKVSNNVNQHRKQLCRGEDYLAKGEGKVKEELNEVIAEKLNSERLKEADLTFSLVKHSEGYYVENCHHKFIDDQRYKDDHIHENFRQSFVIDQGSMDNDMKGGVVFDLRFGFGRASAPSGASVGYFEALEIRDLGHKRFHGFGVETVVKSINNVIARYLVGESFRSQEEFDNLLIKLDSSQNKSKFGANALLPLSVAFAKASSQLLCCPLYQYLADSMSSQHKRRNFLQNLQRIKPMVNIINGGVHADNSLTIQEFMIVPTNGQRMKYGANLDTHKGAFCERVRVASEIMLTLKEYLKKRGFATNVGDEGGFAPNFYSSDQALQIITEVIKDLGYDTEVKIALDAAANEFYDQKKERYAINCEENSYYYTREELVKYYERIAEKYSIISIEDPMSEFDLEGWSLITKFMSQKIQIVGDDLFVTNRAKILHGAANKVANSVLIKMNQIGTVTETLCAIETAHSLGYSTIISHRSGETEDSTIAHLAVASGSEYVKFGSMARTDRLCKYNELLRIEEYLMKQTLV